MTSATRGRAWTDIPWLSWVILLLCSLSEIGEVMSRPLVGMEEEPSQLERLCLATRAAVLGETTSDADCGSDSDGDSASDSRLAPLSQLYSYVLCLPAYFLSGTCVARRCRGQSMLCVPCSCCVQVGIAEKGRASAPGCLHGDSGCADHFAAFCLHSEVLSEAGILDYGFPLGNCIEEDPASQADTSCDEESARLDSLTRAEDDLSAQLFSPQLSAFHNSNGQHQRALADGASACGNGPRVCGSKGLSKSSSTFHRSNTGPSSLSASLPKLALLRYGTAQSVGLQPSERYVASAKKALCSIPVCHGPVVMFLQQIVAGSCSANQSRRIASLSMLKLFSAPTQPACTAAHHRERWADRQRRAAVRSGGWRW